MKREYDRDKGLANGIIYANQHYKIFPAPEVSRYAYDKGKNLYTSRDAEENASRYMQDQYNDPSHLRQYQKLAPQEKSKFKPDAVRPGQSLFFTVCGEGADRSYHYDGFIEYKIPHQ